MGYLLVWCYNYGMETARGYLTKKELGTYAPGVTGTDPEKLALIERAEALIDSYIGHQTAAVHELRGVARAATTNTLQLSAEDVQRANGVNYLKGCTIEILDGTAAGSTARVKTSALDGTITTYKDWDEVPDTDSYYRIYQAGKLPRAYKDLTNDTVSGVNTYFRVIPVVVKQAVAAQCEYIQQMGEAYFTGGDSNMQSESSDGYSYTRGENGTNGKGLIAPAVRSLLAGSGIINRAGGQIIVPNTIL